MPVSFHRPFGHCSLGCVPWHLPQSPFFNGLCSRWRSVFLTYVFLVPFQACPCSRTLISCSVMSLVTSASVALPPPFSTVHYNSLRLYKFPQEIARQQHKPHHHLHHHYHDEDIPIRIGKGHDIDIPAGEQGTLLLGELFG